MHVIYNIFYDSLTKYPGINRNYQWIALHNQGALSKTYDPSCRMNPWVVVWLLKKKQEKKTLLYFISISKITKLHYILICDCELLYYNWVWWNPFICLWKIKVTRYFLHFFFIMKGSWPLIIDLMTLIDSRETFDKMYCQMQRFQLLITVVTNDKFCGTPPGFT